MANLDKLPEKEETNLENIQALAYWIKKVAVGNGLAPHNEHKLLRYLYGIVSRAESMQMDYDYLEARTKSIQKFDSAFQELADK